MNHSAASGRSIKTPAAQSKFAASGGELYPKVIKNTTQLIQLLKGRTNVES